MALPKLFERIFWHNNTTPAINEDNLNAISKGLSDVDDRVIELAGTIMEDVPEIQHDLEILEPAIENIDSNVERAETAADNAEEDALKSEGYAVGTQDGVEVTSGEYYQNNAKYYAEIANPPIENTVDFTDIITISDAINKAAKDVRLKVEAVQDLHGYDKPWVGGAGKNLINKAAGSYTASEWLKQPLVLPAGTYTFSMKSSETNGQFSIMLYDSSDNVIYNSATQGNPSLSNPQRTFTIAAQSARIVSYINVASNLSEIQIEAGSTATAYEPYENICPITGWTGAKPTVANENLFNGTYNEFVYCPIPKNTQFTASIDASASGVYFGVYDKYKNEIDYWILSNTTPDGNRKYRVITLTKDVYYVKFYSVQGSNYAVKLGDDKVFSPYATTYTIDLNGTRYGGTLDVTRGVLTLNKGYYKFNGNETMYGTSPNFNLNIPDKAYGITNVICSHYPTSNSATISGMPDFSVKGNTANSYLNIKNSTFADVTAAKAGMVDVEIVYELATPQTIQLTAEEVDLLYGYNTLFGDCGDISLTYDASGIIHIEEAKIDTETLKTIAAASSDFADFKARIAAL